MSSQPAVQPSSVPGNPPKSDRFPSGIPFIVGNEGAERFSFYGMRAILYAYLAQLFLQFKDEATLAPDAVASAHAHATTVTHLFIAGVYAFPMIGAILSDRLLGKYRVIFWVSLVYVLGHALLALGGGVAKTGAFGPAQWIFFGGLAAIAIGSGGIKPCVSANVGDQFTAGNSHLVERVFQIFYFIINFGSFFSTVAIPIVKAKFGADVAFAIPGVLMAIAAFVFWLGRNKFVKVPPKPGGKLGALDFAIGTLLFVPFAILAFGHVIEEGVAGYFIQNGLNVAGFFSTFFTTYWPHLLICAVAVVGGFLLFSVREKMQQDTGFLAMLVYCFRHRGERKPGQGFFEPARAKFGDDAADGPAAVLRLMLVFSAVSAFWALFDQSASTWVQQAKEMELGLTLPTYLYWYVVSAVVGGALCGAAWVFLYVGNVVIPKVAYYVVGALFVVGLVVAVGLQMTTHAIGDFPLDAAQLQAYNPLMVMIIIPAITALLYKPMEKRGRPLKPLHKMTAGMFLAAAGFLIAALLQMRMEHLAPSGVKIHALWQALQYGVMTTAEVLVSITGLEFAYTQAPRSMKSTIMGFWLLCVSIGDLIDAFLAPLEKVLTLSQFFLTFTILMAVAATVFAVMAYFYKGKTYLQDAAAH